MKKISTETLKRNRTNSSAYEFIEFTYLRKTNQLLDNYELANGWYEFFSPVGEVQVHYVNGNVHCETGPAVIYLGENIRDYYLNGIKCEPTNFIRPGKMDELFIEFIKINKMNEVLDK